MDRDPPSEGPLARLRTALAGPRGYRKIDALLSADDAAGAIAALAPGEIFELVHAVGFEDAIDLIHLATPAQIRGCLDIDAWDGDRVALAPMRPWLTAVMGAGYEKLGEVWAGLDAELRALFLQRQVEIVDLSLGEEVRDDEDRPIYRTPDGFFALILAGDDEQMRFVHELVEELYRADADLARHTIMAARSEPPTELEEESYRWRKGRMADLGYVDFYEALDLFQPLEADAVAIDEDTADRPGAILDETLGSLPLAIAEQVVARSFLARAFARLDAAGAAAVEQALLVLVNRVLAAARVKPGDAIALARAADYATATVSLGLEAVARGDVARAEQALRSVAIVRLFRAGYTLARKLKKLADGLAPRAATAGPPADALLAALRAPWPMLTRALDPPVVVPAGAPPLAPARPFESAADVRRAAEALTRLAVRVTLVEALGVDLVAMGQMPEPRPALDDHARTAVARAAAGGEATGAALTPAELARFRAATEAGAVTAAARQRAQAQVAALAARAGLAAPAQVAALVDGWLDELGAILGGVAGPIDPRFVEGVLVATQRS